MRLSFTTICIAARWPSSCWEFLGKERGRYELYILKRDVDELLKHHSTFSVLLPPLPPQISLILMLSSTLWDSAFLRHLNNLAHHRINHDHGVVYSFHAALVLLPVTKKATPHFREGEVHHAEGVGGLNENTGLRPWESVHCVCLYVWIDTACSLSWSISRHANYKTVWKRLSGQFKMATGFLFLCSVSFNLF